MSDTVNRFIDKTIMGYLTPQEALKKINKEIYELEIWFANNEPGTSAWIEKKELWQIKLTNREEIKSET